MSRRVSLQQHKVRFSQGQHSDPSATELLQKEANEVQFKFKL